MPLSVLPTRILDPHPAVVEIETGVVRPPSTRPPTSFTFRCTAYLPPRTLLFLSRRSIVCSLHPNSSASWYLLKVGCFLWASKTCSLVILTFLFEILSA